MTTSCCSDSAKPQTRTAPPRVPSGWFVGHYRYRNYVLFGFTCVPMLAACAFLLWGVCALGRGSEAWSAYLAAMATLPALATSVLALVFTLYFAIRWSWVGRKIPAGAKIMGFPIAPPAPMPLHGILPLGGFVTLWIVVLLILGGVIL